MCAPACLLPALPLSVYGHGGVDGCRDQATEAAAHPTHHTTNPPDGPTTRPPNFPHHPNAQIHNHQHLTNEPTNQRTNSPRP